MKALLVAKSIVETAAGLALIFFPSTVVYLFIRLPVATAAGAFVGRWTGIAVFVLGIVCWLSRDLRELQAAIRLVLALLFYDVGFIVLLLISRFGEGLSGVVLWPGILLHSGLALWSVFLIRKART